MLIRSREISKHQCTALPCFSSYFSRSALGPCILWIITSTPTVGIHPTPLSKDMMAKKVQCPQALSEPGQIQEGRHVSILLTIWAISASVLQWACGIWSRFLDTITCPLCITLYTKWQFRIPIRTARKLSSLMYDHKGPGPGRQRQRELLAATWLCQPCGGQDDGMMPSSCYWVTWLREPRKESTFRQSPPAYITTGNAHTLWLTNSILGNLFYRNTSP